MSPRNARYAPPERSHEPRTLRTLNSVLCKLLGGDPRTGEDINAALALMETDEVVGDAPLWETERLAEAARNLLRMHAPKRRFGGEEIALADFRGEPFDPLFARVRVMEALSRIPAGSEPILWVTGLREAFVPRTSRRTSRSVAEYLAAQALIEDMALRGDTHRGCVRLIFL